MKAKKARRKKKATRAEIAQRIEAVLKLRLLGADFEDIRQYASGDEKEGRGTWDVSERQLWRYIAASDKLLEKRDESDRKRLFRRHVAQRKALYARCMEAGDWRAALAVLRDEAELTGLYEMSFEERLVEMEARLAAAIKAPPATGPPGAPAKYPGPPGGEP